MFQKAVTFDDMKTAKLIMSESKPLNQKRLGRLVQGFKKQIWDTKCIEVVKPAAYTGKHYNPDKVTSQLDLNLFIIFIYLDKVASQLDLFYF